MADYQVIIELAHSKKVEDNFRAVTFGDAQGLDRAVAPALPGLTVDESFPPVAIPAVSDRDIPEGEIFDTERKRCHRFVSGVLELSRPRYRGRDGSRHIAG